MSLEGRLRELGLPEVLQLLGLSRKTGTLHLHAQVQDRAAFVRLTKGAVVDAAQWRLNDVAGDDTPPGLAVDATAVKAVELCVLDLLSWRDGDFRFTPDESARPKPSPVRIGVEMLLVESAQRAETWARIADRIEHAHVVPTFVDVEPQQLPLLRLVPQEWEILTRVDGQRDLTELADALGRELLDVAEIVHGLIGSGLLTVREVEAAPRRNPTPPIGAMMLPPEGATIPIPAAEPVFPLRDSWVPPAHDAIVPHSVDDDPHGDEDTLFDPAQGGVVRSGGRPRRRTTPRGVAALTPPAPLQSDAVVAPKPAEPSVSRGEASWPMPGVDAKTLCMQGDDAARRGDLPAALAFWSAALRSEATIAEADRIREAIALAARLHALLHSAERRT